MKTLAILDTREILSAGLASLATRSGLQFAGHWRSAREALRALAEAPPDVLVLGTALSHQLLERSPPGFGQRFATILVVERGEPLDWGDFGQLAVEALLTSDAPAEDVEACFSAIAYGRAWLDPNLYRSLGEVAVEPIDWGCLSSRELEVAHLAALGVSNKHIAKALNVADGTVKMHMHHILTKLHVARRADLDGARLSPDREHSSSS